LRRTTFAILASLLVPALLAADVTWEEETKMGGMMQIMTMGKAMKSTTRVSGNFMRTDSDSNATIIDLEGERILNLDTKKKTYTVTTFAEMMKQMESAMATVSGKKPAESQGKDVTMTADIDVTDTGRTETIGGVGCSQYLMEMDVTFESEKEQQAGTMSTVMEVWLAKNVPGMEEVNAFHRKMGEKLGTTSIAQKWAGGGGQNPQMSANMQKMADEMKKMEGHSMRSVMYLGDAEAAKAEAMGQKPADGGGGGGLGGLAEMMKRMQQQEGGGEQSNQAPGGVMMKMTTETKKIETNPIDPKLFAVPADYKLVTESR
jgi:hypothetical protein